jgi:AbrB family looped-hinge helix DNA binding protein
MVRARITSKGQLTIPVEIRRRYGLDTGDEVEFISEERGAYLVPLKRRKLTDLYGILPATRPWPGMKRAREIYSKKIGEEYARKNKVRR